MLNPGDFEDGHELLLKFENPSVVGDWKEFAAIGAPKISFSQDKREVSRAPRGSAAASAWWSLYLKGGKRTISISGDYSAVDGDAESLVYQVWFDGQAEGAGTGELNVRVTDPFIGTLQGVFAVTQFERDTENELAGSINLMSNGTIVRTAPVA